MTNRIMAGLSILIVLNITVIVIAREFSETTHADIDIILRKLNKPALKSIKSPDGDIIDCVHMKNHPIYDHPLFKNYTIQMRPSSYPNEWNKESSTTGEKSMLTQLWNINEKCPKNSIPIIRTRKQDILRADSIERYGRKHPNSFPQQKPNNQSVINCTHEHAIVTVRSPQTKFHGAKAIINVWKPWVQKRKEFSLAQIWVTSGDYPSTLNSIEAGWQVYPRLYGGDDNPRFFIYWTRDAYNQTGCYNLKCEGFVQVNQNFAIGGALSQFSTYGGEQKSFSMTIWKDSYSGNWWLKVGAHQIIGYWPSSLFTLLRDGATDVDWGGEVINCRDGLNHTKTHMGSGHFGNEGYEKASHFRNLEIVDHKDITQPPQSLTTLMDKEPCYNILPGHHTSWENYFYYGGPGGNHNLCHM